jgi:hypothetical protein
LTVIRRVQTSEEAEQMFDALSYSKGDFDWFDLVPDHGVII